MQGGRKWITYTEEAAKKKIPLPSTTAQGKAPKLDPAPKPAVTRTSTVGAGPLQASKRPASPTADSSLPKRRWITYSEGAAAAKKSTLLSSTAQAKAAESPFQHLRGISAGQVLPKTMPRPAQAPHEKKQGLLLSLLATSQVSSGKVKAVAQPNSQGAAAENRTVASAGAADPSILKMPASNTTMRTQLALPTLADPTLGVLQGTLKGQGKGSAFSSKGLAASSSAGKGSAITSRTDAVRKSPAGTITRAPNSTKSLPLSSPFSQERLKTKLQLAKASSAGQQTSGLSKVKQGVPKHPLQPSPASQSSEAKMGYVKTEELDYSEIQKHFEEVADSIWSRSEHWGDPEVPRLLASAFASKLPQDMIMTLVEVLSDTLQNK